ncbi:MAG: VOC family protein [Phenylobacterium sp.]|uniref:VOC family protein n=1 Tax=Phenylobacterium sp. TaxID=1871053 RepID=UPI0012241214|nr:VOC family protein [Phenylobacterium sp.]TAL32170.1 MAG: VOC family protein [Phenylobacterium sp.]
MFDHLSLGVRDLGAARRFYNAFFAPLGASIASEKPGEIAYGPGGASGLLYLYSVEGERVAGLGAHLAFKAETRAAVDAAYASAMAQGATAIRVAGPHPDIAPDYYGCVILDPDGNKLEIVAGTMH